MRLDGPWEFWPDPEGAGESIGVFLPAGGTGVEPYWAAGWPGYEPRPAREPQWRPIPVPGHWQAQGYAGYQGPGWYRLRFTPAPADGRPFLEFGGVDHYADVWLNGDYLGFHEGYFDPFAFDVSGILRLGEENLLVVRVASPLDRRPEHKEIPKGGTYHWDALPVRQGALAGVPEVPSAANPQYPHPIENPAGIWQPVHLSFRGEVHMARLAVTPLLAPDYRRADVAVGVEMENYGAAIELPVRLVLCGHNFEAGDLPRYEGLIFLPPGRSAHTFRLTLDQPALWWSWDLGFPHLYRLTAEVGGAAGTVVFGVREFRKGDAWELYLNGRRFFARGTNYLSDRYLSLATPDRYQQDVHLMLAANMNMVRVFAHLEQEEFYALCDERGIMVFQDLPFQWGYSSEGLFIQRAAEVARRAVARLYNHPSVVLLCAHSESRIHDFNKLDEVLLRAVAEVDRTRPVVKSSVLADQGLAPRRWDTLVAQREYTRKHMSVLWVGWYWGQLADIEAYNPLFVTEFGTQSLPGLESLRRILPPEQLWPPDWEAWREKGFQKNIYERNLGPVPERLEDLVERTQAYQCRFYKTVIEALRRKKYQHVNGLLQFLFVDNWPAITWSIIDYYRVPKPAYAAVREAFAPLLLTFTLHPSRRELAVWIVNDYHRPFAGLRVRLQGQEIPLPEVRPDAAAIYARLPVPAGTASLPLAAELVDGSGAVLSRWEGELEPYQIPPEMEPGSLV